MEGYFYPIKINVSVIIKKEIRQIVNRLPISLENQAEST